MIHNSVSDSHLWYDVSKLLLIKKLFKLGSKVLTPLIVLDQDYRSINDKR